MGIRVFDPEDPAGYDCTASANCTCSCCSNSNSSSNSSSSSRGCSTNSNANDDSSSSSACNCSNINNRTCSSCNINRCIRTHKPVVPSLTLTFANNNSYNGTASNYHFSETETLQTQANATSINTTTTTATTHITTKDLVGNCKEYRIDSNTCDLRIIGNSNRIRIGCNVGNLQIIGNSTRLKIANNSGKIRYTGNEGRICLGSDSAHQIVDYIGNNGKLKVVKSAELLSEKCKNHKQKIPQETDEFTGTQNTTTTPLASMEQKYAASVKTTATSSATANSSATTTTTKTAFPPCSTPKKAKVKSASFAGDYSAQWQKFNKLFERHSCRRNYDRSSMPNLKSEGEHETDFGKRENAEKHTINGDGSKITGKCCKIENNINIVNTYGNICIKNAVNVSI